MSEEKPPTSPPAETLENVPELRIQKAPAAQTAAAALTMTTRGVQLQNLEDLLRFAGMCVQNGAAPKGMNQAQAAIAIQTGLERGMSIMTGLQAAVVINGVLSWRGWAVTGLIQNSSVIVPGTFQSWVEGEGDNRTGYCRAQRKGYDRPFIRSFSIKDAKLAGLLRAGTPWATRPDNMLEWRAIGDMGRFHFGDVLGGMPIAEDVEAGGIGPQEPIRELPATRSPHPPAVVKDPVLAELQAGPTTPATLKAPITVEAVPVASGGRVGVPPSPEVTPEMRAVIDAQVDEVFAPREAKPADPPPAAGPCERCTAKLNELGGCDVCGWPGADNGERP
jgi:hypothetical protein